LAANTGAASGVANSLDTGAWAFSTWYNVFVIYNGTTSALLFSLSATAPTLPSGYTYFARIGAIKTQSATNYNPLSFRQYGCKVRYVVATGSNVTALPSMASGTLGTYSATAPVWAAVSVSGVTPPTASSITILWVSNSTNAGATAIALAPNNSYSGTKSSNAPVFQYDAATTMSMCIEMELESTNIYATSNGAACLISAYGYEDNL
jgi:hypothetical protein